jgi:hypothetical protein
VQGKGDVAGGERSSSGQPGIPDAPDAFPFKQIKNNSQQNRVLKEPQSCLNCSGQSAWLVKNFRINKKSAVTVD